MKLLKFTIIPNKLIVKRSCIFESEPKKFEEKSKIKILIICVEVNSDLHNLLKSEKN